jgi:RNA polymerase sigma factor (sigma-70 family)
MQGYSPPVDDAARKRVAVEILARHERTLRRTARRYSICAEDAEDAFQRALEILLTKAPQAEARELIRWMQTVTKHEALAVRRGRERQMGPMPRNAEDAEDWVAQIPSQGAGPAERAERSESIARSREALQTLKPQELRALTLLAEGYSYAEIGEITGWTRTKINRCLAEGRERYRAVVSRSESGGRCAELRPVLSAFCDGETSAAEAASLREHLRACAHCRAAMRSYRAAPRAAAALAPVPLLPSLLHRAQETVAGIQARLAERFPGGGTEAAAQVVGGGGSGIGVAAKALAVCAGTAGSAAACIGAGVVPSPIQAHSDRPIAPKVRLAEPPVAVAEHPPEAPVVPVSSPSTAGGDANSREGRGAESAEIVVESGAVASPPEPAAAAPPPEPAPTPATPSSAQTAAGEFGP